MAHSNPQYMLKFLEARLGMYLDETALIDLMDTLIISVSMSSVPRTLKSYSFS